MRKCIIGIDEAGRGPLAGPVAVCAAAVEAGFDIKAAFIGVNDSKQMTPRARERVFEAVLVARAQGDVRFAVSYGSPTRIDTDGITRAVAYAVNECMSALAFAPTEVQVYLDGLLKAPEPYPQKTVIHGDALIPVISLASVIAKVSRDRLMADLAHEYPQYGFERHKGYGTSAHYAALKEFGPSPLHRMSFLRNALVLG